MDIRSRVPVVFKHLPFVFILTIISTVQGGQICHVCEDIPRPEDCPYVKECGPHETCSTESYSSPSGHILYKMGCKDTAQCNGFTLNSVYTPICSGCCSGNLCGVAMCGNSGYPTTRGPVCLNCIYKMDQPSHCGKIKVCSRDESCGVQKFDNGLYAVKCMSSQSCDLPEPKTKCTQCCNQDVCNQNCRLPSDCLDSNPTFCKNLQQKFPTFCTSPDLASGCNRTCLGNVTCDGIPGLSVTQSTSNVKLTTPITTPITKPSTMSKTVTTTTTTTRRTTYYFPDGKPCTDEPSCTAIQTTGADFCSKSDFLGYCNETCGFCPFLTGNGGADPCVVHPCVHGQCSPGINGASFTCKCDLGYMGALCENPDPCYRQPCVHGQCIVRSSVGGFECKCDLGFSGLYCNMSLVRDCQDVLDNKIPSPTSDNTYVIDITESILGSRKLNVKCEFTSNHGWTVLMNRDSGQLNFDDKLSTEYAVGFGNVRDEFWMGLEYMHAVTSDGRRYQLRVDLTVANGSHYYQLYDDFTVGPHNQFLLGIGNSYGSAGDALTGHNNFAFTTKDRDQDSNAAENCARYISGGWWFHDCADSCLTCNYIVPGTKDCKAMSWHTLGHCIALKKVSMQIRPL